MTIASFTTTTAFPPPPPDVHREELDSMRTTLNGLSTSVAELKAKLSPLPTLENATSVDFVAVATDITNKMLLNARGLAA